MKDPGPSEAHRLARHVLTSRLESQRGENVTIETFPTALPWAIGLVREARRLGARRLFHYEDACWTATDEGGLATLGTPGSHDWAALAETEVYIRA